MRNSLADKVYMVIFISQVQVRSVFLLMVLYTISHVNIEDIGLDDDALVYNCQHSVLAHVQSLQVVLSWDSGSILMDLQFQIA